MGKKPPLFSNVKPMREYNLDDSSVREKLGIPEANPSQPSKVSDRYVVYANNKRAVIEYKTSSMHKAVKQLTVTTELLFNANNQVDYVVVVGSINPTESRIYKQEHRKYRLIDPSQNNRPYAITVSSRTWEILIFTEDQVNNMYDGMFKYLSEG